MKKLNRSAFTLVELLVVITILAILGTIAFINIQGYSADARDSKRIEDLTNLKSQISIKVIDWVSIISLVSSGANNLASASIAWTGVTIWTDYLAWIPNYSALWIKSSDVKDPQGDDYAVGITTINEGNYELAATLEKWLWDDSANS